MDHDRRISPGILGAVGSLTVLGAGWVLSKLPGLPTGAVTLPRTLLRLRALPHAHGVAFVLVVAGLALLVVAWIDLLRLVRRTGEVDVVHRCAIAWNAPLLLAPPLFSLDGWAYAAQGTLAARGLSPYADPPAMLQGTTGQAMAQAMDPRWVDAPAPYGPLQIGYSDLAAHLTTTPLTLAWAHRLESVLALVVLAWAVPRLATALGGQPAVASAAVVASPFVLATGMAGMHNDLLMIALATAGAAVALPVHPHESRPRESPPRESRPGGRPERWVLGAAVVGLAASIKVPALAVCLVVALATLPPRAALRARVARLVATGTVAVVVLLGTGAIAGAGPGWIRNLAVSDTSLPPFAPLHWLPAGLDLAAPMLLCAATAVLALTCPTGSPRAAAIGLGGVFLIAAVFCGAAYPWYFLWALPWLAAAPLSPAAARAVLGGSALLCLVSPLSDLPRNPLLTATVLGLAVAGVAVWHRRSAHAGVVRATAPWAVAGDQVAVIDTEVRNDP